MDRHIKIQTDVSDSRVVFATDKEWENLRKSYILFPFLFSPEIQRKKYLEDPNISLKFVVKISPSNCQDNHKSHICSSYFMQ